MDAIKYFTNKLHTDEEALIQYMKSSLDGVDGELYLQQNISHGMSLADGKVQSPYSAMDEGFGLRRVVDDKFFFSNGSLDFGSIKEQGIKLAQAQSLSGLTSGGLILPRTGFDLTPRYSDQDVVTNRAEHGFNDKRLVDTLYAIDAFIREQSEEVTNVQASIRMSYSQILMALANGELVTDYRPMIALSIHVSMMRDGQVEQNGDTKSGRYALEDVFSEAIWKSTAQNAFDGAKKLLSAKPCPAGDDLDVLLDSGAAGVLVHEAIGHPFEGDAVWANKSCFKEKDLGVQVAAKGVTLIDDGTIDNWRGSITVDDEGCKTHKTVLLEDGILNSYIHDRISAAKMATNPTGNGRRQSYAHAPITRMTNTYIAGGNTSRDDIIASVKKGILACDFNGGMVDTAKGSFNFGMTLGYYVEDGKIQYPVKLAELQGNCRDALMNIKAVGNDFELSHGGWTCGKQGQSMTVSVGQPTVLITGLTVGGQ